MSRTFRDCLLQAALMALAAIVLPSPLAAQGTRATLTGTVLDPTGAAVPGATVTVRNTETGVRTSTTTTSTGTYTLPHLEAGTYTLTVTADGFRTASRENVILRVAQTLTVNVTLELGAVTEEVTVTGAPPLLEAGTAEIGRYVSEVEYDSWPIMVTNGQRQLIDFAFRSLPGTVGGRWAGTVNGGQSHSFEILVEGISVGRMDLAGSSLHEMSPSADAVNEFKLQTGTISAQYNGTQTAVANFRMKSGTNELHGSGYFYWQDQHLKANSFANNARGKPKSPFSQKNWGYSVGGPVYIPKVYDGRNKTFWFTNLEDTSFKDLTISGMGITLPTRAFKRGDFSRLFDPSFTGIAKSGTVVGTDALGRPVVFGQIYDPATTRVAPDGSVIRDPFPGNIIPKDRWSQVARAVVEDVGITDPELEDEMLRNTPKFAKGTPVLDLRSYGFKVDHHFNERHRLSTYFNRNTRIRFIRASWPPLDGPPTQPLQRQTIRSYIVRASEDWTISPTVLNHFAAGYNRFMNANVSAVLNEGWAEKIGIKNTSPAHFPRFNFSGRPHQGGSVSDRNMFGSSSTASHWHGSYIIQDDLSVVRGSHSLRFGTEYRRYYFITRNPSGSGTYNFSPEQTHLPGFSTETGHAFASFLLGAVRSASRTVVALTPGIRQPQWAFYVSDDWKVTPKLALNLGLRWETVGGFWEVTNRMSTIDLDRPNPAADGRPGAYVFIDEIGRKSFQNRYSKLFSPRFGFSYMVSDKMVIRGGYALLNMPPLRNNWSFGMVTRGFSAPINVFAGTSSTGFPDDPVMNLDDPFPDLEAPLPNKDPGQGLFQGLDIVRPDSNRLPYTQNWNFTIQYQLPAQFVLETAYVGNKGTRLWTRGFGSVNSLPTSVLALGDTLRDQVRKHPEFKPYPSFPDNQNVAQALRPYPHLGSLTDAYPYHGWSSYHALQVTATRHFTAGFGLIAAYTWSKTMNTGDTANMGGLGSVQDQFNRGLEYSLSDHHQPQSFKLSWIYDLPFGPGKKFDIGGVLGYIVGGWRLSGIHNYFSGTPIRVRQSGVRNMLFTGSIRPDVTGLPQTFGPAPSTPDFKNGTPYLNPAGFANVPMTGNGVPLRVGTAPRSLDVRGFHTSSEDFRVTKFFPIRESVNFEFTATFINAFNRSTRGGINTNINSPNFGKFFGGGNGRSIELSARINF